MTRLSALLFILFFSATSLLAQGTANDKRKSPHDTLTASNIKVTYGRPYKKGRSIFGGLESYGKVWRTGADEATELTLTKDATVAGKQVKAGTYSLFTIPGQEEWTLILNSKLGQWGAYEYDKVKDKDVLKAKVKATHLNKAVEQFTIKTKTDGLLLEWDRSSVFVPIKF